MKKALVVGASGGMGYALTCELASRGVDVVAFARRKERLETLFQNQRKVTLIPGDVLNQSSLHQAAKGADVIFHAVSFPYPEWETKHVACLENVLNAAKTEQARVAYVDNIYAYGKQNTPRVTEEAVKEPHTKKGKLRLSMENKLKDSSVPTLIVHLPDLYGPNAENTILHETLKGVVQNKTANFVGSTKVAREFLFTFDGAKVMVDLAFDPQAYNQNWNIPAAHPVTGEELMDILRDITGFKGSVRSVSTMLIRLMGLFSPAMREVVEMMYLTESPVVLSGEKFEREVGPLPRTPYRLGLEQTIAWMKL
ncbi:SDR family NAD(P)-dependent oxidoreductase [Ammoniphilus sp. YIM 78166]|uniref:SDR family NAD(P)-dependent oxidoreductase n=1 Tax=Ammoniphilus sp. YIM 78166 TaxID=1644106 RepID=UPI00106FB20B|nr:SDR family NAD(P)-dependent oxidoreductase [Ammoniphilus sp. YIM 78166]